jgi:hypothetical protein
VPSRPRSRARHGRVYVSAPRRPHCGLRARCTSLWARCWHAEHLPRALSTCCRATTPPLADVGPSTESPPLPSRFNPARVLASRTGHPGRLASRSTASFSCPGCGSWRRRGRRRRGRGDPTPLPLRQRPAVALSRVAPAPQSGPLGRRRASIQDAASCREAGGPARVSRANCGRRQVYTSRTKVTQLDTGTPRGPTARARQDRRHPRMPQERVRGSNATQNTSPGGRPDSLRQPTVRTYLNPRGFLRMRARCLMSCIYMPTRRGAEREGDGDED